MKIRIDVKGTLEGPRGLDIRRMIPIFLDAGHEVKIWSSSYFYAEECSRLYYKSTGINLGFESKLDKWSCDEKYFVDLAIDDDPQSIYLAAKKFLWVSNIPTKNIAHFTMNLIKEIENEISMQNR